MGCPNRGANPLGWTNPMGYPVQSAWIIHREEGAYSTGKYSMGNARCCQYKSRWLILNGWLVLYPVPYLSIQEEVDAGWYFMMVLYAGL